MSEICNTCGLPKELCVCETIAKESQKVTISLEKKKFGKKYTVVRGIDEKEINVKDVTKRLKSDLACGGTAKDGMIELQGDHTAKVKKFLVKLGFPEDSIKVE